MKILIRSVKIIDKKSPFDGQQKDILIENGIITEISNQISATDAEVINYPNAYLSVGWCDMRASAQDPGFEQKESLETLCKAAMAGGFTDVAVLPNTQPTIDSKDTIGYIKQSTANQLVDVHAIGAVTKKCEGKDFTDMIDLAQAGAVAFSDGHHTIESTHILLKSLQYLQPQNKVLMNRPADPHLSIFGQMNEGINSTMLGMRGIPHLAEELMIQRDLQLLEYLENQPDSPVLHFSTISTRKGIAMIRQAKAKGLAVSCDVAAHQVAFDDSELATFDTNFKVNPPFRTQDDIAAIWEGLADGTIDAVVSDHTPHDEEAKNLEFDLADFGIIGLETVFSVLNTYNNTLTISQLIEKITTNPRTVLRLPQPSINIGQPANLTVFDPNMSWQFTTTHSKSKNSPFFGKTLKGRALKVLKNQLFF